MNTFKIYPATGPKEAARIAHYMNLTGVPYKYDTDGLYVTMEYPKKKFPLYMHERVDLTIRGIVLVLRNPE